MAVPSHSSSLAERHTGPKPTFPADRGSGAETPGCSWCRHPRQWGRGLAIILPAMASGQRQAGVCVPGGFRSARGGRAGRAANKSVSKSLCWPCWATIDVPRGGCRQSPVKLLFHCCFQREVTHRRPNQPQENAIGPLPKGCRRTGTPLPVPGAPAVQGSHCYLW